MSENLDRVKELLGNRRAKATGRCSGDPDYRGRICRWAICEIRNRCANC